MAGVFQAIAVSAVFLGLAGAGHAQDTTTLSNVTVKALKKPKEAFFASATLTVTDTSNPPDGVNGAPFAALADAARNPNWNFDLKILNPNNPAGNGYIRNNPALGFATVGLLIGASGNGFGHLNPPHLGEPSQNLANQISALPALPYGADNAVKLNAMGTVKHQGFKNTHFDTYAVRGTVTAQLGPPNRLVAPIDVAAIHSDFDPAQNPFFSLFDYAVASRGAHADFDAVAGLLSLRPAAIDVLDALGGASGAIDPRFAADPLRLAHWQITPLAFHGLGSDGLFHFGGGSMTMSDPSGRFDLSARFDEFFIDATPDGRVSAFGQLSQLLISDTAGADGSRFLDAFFGLDVLRDGMEEDSFAGYGGIVLSLGDVAGLLAETAGFSRSAGEIPTRLTLAALRVPEPSSLLLAGLALLLLAGRRAVAAALALATVTAGAQDTTAFTNANFPRDTPTRFLASGTLTSSDGDTPANGIGNAPFVSVLGPNKNWRFRIAHVDNFLLPANRGLRGVGLTITGTKAGTETAAAGHLVPPQGAGHGGEQANTLGSFNSERKDIVFGADKSEFISVWGTQKHAKHFDAYGLRSTITAQQGPPLRLTGVADVVGVHVAADPEAKLDFDGKPLFDPFKEALASTAGGGARLAYDALTGTLRLTPGLIDVLDQRGGASGAIDPAYATDPLRTALWQIDPLVFLGSDALGNFHFGGGNLRLSDPAGSFAIAAHIDELVFPGNGAGGGIGLVDQLSILDTGGAGASAFLRAFVDTDLFLAGLDDGEAARWAGIGFFVAPAGELAALTRGFSVSAADVPARFVLSALAVPAPGTLALTGAALLLAALWTRRQQPRQDRP